MKSFRPERSHVSHTSEKSFSFCPSMMNHKTYTKENSFYSKLTIPTNQQCEHENLHFAKTRTVLA